ncbi:MAG: NFACT family protein, partial [Melioribacteraceae bacterium]|nr:NFACT family protein [Melioribacteraceae bacterium]
MLKNYYYLNRSVIELNSILQNSVIKDIYSQEKNKLYISIPTEELPFRHLIVSTNPNLPYLQIREEHHKARKNVINYFNEQLPAAITKIEIAESDRLIKFTTNKFSFYFSIRGGKTNIYFTLGSTVIEQLKKSKNSDEETLIFENINFVSDDVYHEIDEQLIEKFNFKEIKYQYPYITKEILNELQLRYEKDKNIKLKKLLDEIIAEIYKEQIMVSTDPENKHTIFAPATFELFNKYKSEYIFRNYNSALIEYLKIKYRFVRFYSNQKIIKKHLDKELEKTSNKLNNLKSRVETGEKSDIYYNYGNLLLVNRDKFKKGMGEIIVDDIQENETIKIKLNETHSVQESINYYFNKAKGEKINFTKSLELYEITKTKYHKLLELDNRFNKIDSNDELLLIKKELKLSDNKKEKTKLEYKAKLREFLIDDKYKVLVGMDSKSNDLLST